MHRRDLLSALPVTAGLASTALVPEAQSSPYVTPKDMIIDAKAQRLIGMKPWSSEPKLKPSIRRTKGAKGTIFLALTAKSTKPLPANAQLGISFDQAPDFKHGVTFWRYAPWKSWTKPVKMTSLNDLNTDDVQCAYWQYADGTYGVALPLGGGGFRATLGLKDGRFSTLASALAPATIREALPQLAIGFGPDLYSVMEAVFEDTMSALGTPENLRKNKSFPEQYRYLGWNTWNASDNGRNMSEAWVLEQVERIKAAGAPIGSLVLDDGYFDADDGRLQSLTPNKQKFPNGLKSVVDKLKAKGMHYVGVWHALNIYWNGIDPSSALGKKYEGKIFSWQQKPSPIDTSGRIVTYHSLKPESAVLKSYFETYYTELKAAGIGMVKIDNQLVVERMAKDNYPVWDLAVAYHTAINEAAGKFFNNAVINCMDMTNDAFLNFGKTAIARTVEDYFPYKIGETYDLQEGNAAAHILQAIYNALYFSQVAFPDFDMFESTNPNARLHAMVRAVNNAPLYVTDKAGQHNVELLRNLVDAKGLTLHADTPLLPTPDCLFQVQDHKIFKAWSLSAKGGNLAIMNLADTPRVTGFARLSDIQGLPKAAYCVWSQFEERLYLPAWDEPLDFTLSRFGHELLRAAPIEHGRAVLGLREKLSGLASIKIIHSTISTLILEACDRGVLLIYCDVAPASIMVDGKAATFSYKDKLLRIVLNDGHKSYKIELNQIIIA